MNDETCKFSGGCYEVRYNAAVFFPYIGYWQLLNAVDEYVIFDDVNYVKRGVDQ